MAIRNWRLGLAAVIASVAVAGCLPESAESEAQSPAPAEESPNRAPVISGNPGLTATVGVSWQFQPGAVDADGDALTFSATGLPAWATIHPQTGLLSGTPALADVGTTASIVVSVFDGEATASLTAFSITVAAIVAPPPVGSPAPPSNTAPVISGAPSTTVRATAAYSFTPGASDAETPQGLSFSITNKPAWAAFSTTTGTLSGTPTSSQTGTYGNIRVSVSDGALSASLPVFSITVTAAPDRAPTISGTPAASVTAGTAYSFRPTAADPDGQRLTFSISNRPTWATFSTTTGRLSGTPTNSHIGTTAGIVITVSDGTQSAALSPFSVTVTAQANRAPTISGSPATRATQGAIYRFRPTASDADNDTLTWSIGGKPADAAFSTTTGELNWTPSATGTWSNIVITVTDSAGASASLPAFSIAVAPPAQLGSAELSWAAPTEYTDGSPLAGAQIAAYRIYHGSSAGTLGRVAEVDSNSIMFTVTDLTAGTHYFAVTAVTQAGAESSFSQVGSKTIN